MAHDVFICFSSIDQEAANTVLDRLEKEGVRCWISSRDMGAGWFTQKLTDSIMESKILLLVFSAHSNNSEYCINEVHTAFNKKGMVVPFVIDNSLPTGDMAFYLQRFQRIDAHGKVSESSLQRLVNEVKTVISQLSPPPATEAKPATPATVSAPDTPLASKPASTGKGKVWLWAGAAVILIAAAALVLKFTVFNTATGTVGTPPGDSVLTQNDATTTPPATTTAPITTTPPPPTTTAPPVAAPKEYVELTFVDTVMDPDIINGTQPFNITLNGTYTCVKDIPYDIRGLSIRPIIRGIRYGETNYVDLVTSSNITATEVPLHKGETVSFSQVLEVQFPEGAATGKYDIYFNAQKIKIDIGIWVDIEEFFQLNEQYLGVVDYTAPSVGVRPAAGIYAASLNIFYMYNNFFVPPDASVSPARLQELLAATPNPRWQQL